MPRYKRLAYYLLWFSVILICYCESAVVSQHYFNSHGISVCTGSDNFKSHDGLSRQSSAYWLRRMKIKYGRNCSLVRGNLEITNYQPGINESSFDESDLDFLNAIEEVTGYVLIYNMTLPKLTLMNLKIIRGDVLPVEIKAGLYIENNNINYLALPSLRVVENGILYMNSNKGFCHKDKMDLFSMVLDKSRNIGFPQKPDYSVCPTGVAETHCSKNCEEFYVNFDRDLNDVCWSDEFCQLPYISDMCPNGFYGDLVPFLNNPRNSSAALQVIKSQCCDLECLGGCTGPNNTHCDRCRNVDYDGTCLPKCPESESYDWAKGEMMSNPQGLYQFQRNCVKQCPLSTYEYKDKCLNACPMGTMFNLKVRKCIPCAGSSCIQPGVCKIQPGVKLYGKNMCKLTKGCHVIEGAIHISSRAWRQKENRGVRPWLSNKDLDCLKDIEVVTDYVFIQYPHQHMDPPYTLEYLGNLREIHGKRLYSNMVLHVATSPKLLSFNTPNLRIIGSTGTISIRMNPRLCYIQGLAWEELLVDDRKRNPMRITPAASICENKTCDAMCNQTAGCFGPGPEMCLKCRFFREDSKCVEKCNDQGYYTLGDQCTPCNPECLTCQNTTECLLCKHTLLEGANRSCLLECPSTHYLEKGYCQACSPDCKSHGCTGGGSFVGEGGCNRCSTGVDMRNGTFTCLLGGCETSSPYFDQDAAYFAGVPADSFKHITNYQCIPCNTECNSCTSAHTKYKISKDNSCYLDGCDCKHFAMQHTNECVATCNKPNFIVEKRRCNTSDTIWYRSTCIACHRMCSGCHEYGNILGEHCTNCSHLKLRYKITIRSVEVERTECIEKCPLDKPYHDADNYCTDHVPINNSKPLMIILGITFGVVFLLLIILCCCIARRRKLAHEDKLLIEIFKNEGNDPLELLGSKTAPNLSEFKLISEAEIERRELLGSGNFGVVYKGIYVPRKHKGTRIACAIKCLREPTCSKQKMEILEEAQTMARIVHPNLLAIIGFSMGQSDFMLVMPLMILGSLRDFIVRYRDRIASAPMIGWCRQIADAMACLEENRIVHRDLALRNILVKTPSEIVIADLGLAKLLDSYEKEYRAGPTEHVPFKWLAIESMREQKFSHKTDVWAFGITLWEIVTFGEKPYDRMTNIEVIEYLHFGERLTQPGFCSIDLYMLMIKCWMEDPENRPSFKNLFGELQHMCLDPPRYLCIPREALIRLPSFTPDEQYAMLQEMLNCSEQQQLLYEQHEIERQLSLNSHGSDWFGRKFDSQVSTPMSPNSPSVLATWQASGRNERAVSQNSQRYATEPQILAKIREGSGDFESDEETADSSKGTADETDNENYLLPRNLQKIVCNPKSSRASPYYNLMKTAENARHSGGSDSGFDSPKELKDPTTLFKNEDTESEMETEITALVEQPMEALE